MADNTRIHTGGETVFSMEELFPGGYVVELGKCLYLRERKRRRISACGLPKARRFASERAAMRYAKQHLCYAGMELYLCRIDWVLVSYQEDHDQCYWTGKEFSKDKAQALSFPDYEAAHRYQEKYQLESETYADQMALRLRQLLPAA